MIWIQIHVDRQRNDRKKAIGTDEVGKRENKAAKEGVRAQHRIHNEIAKEMCKDGSEC